MVLNCYLKLRPKQKEAFSYLMNNNVSKLLAVSGILQTSGRIIQDSEKVHVSKPFKEIDMIYTEFFLTSPFF